MHVWNPASSRNSPKPWECGSSTFFPQEEQVRRQAGARPYTGSSLQLCVESISLNLVFIRNIDQHMYMYLSAPTPDQVHWECGSSTFLPWEKPVLGQVGKPLIYWFKLIVLRLSMIIFIKIDDYTGHWPLHVRAPICPYAGPIPWECGSSTLSSPERGRRQGRPAHNHAAVQSSSLHTVCE